MTLSLTQS